MVKKHLLQYFVMNNSLTIFCHLKCLYGNRVIISPALKSWEKSGPSLLTQSGCVVSVIWDLVCETVTVWVCGDHCLPYLSILHLHQGLTSNLKRTTQSTHNWVHMMQTLHQAHTRKCVYIYIISGGLLNVLCELESPHRRQGWGQAYSYRRSQLLKQTANKISLFVFERSLYYPQSNKLHSIPLSPLDSQSSPSLGQHISAPCRGNLRPGLCQFCLACSRLT